MAGYWMGVLLHEIAYERKLKGHDMTMASEFLRSKDGFNLDADREPVSSSVNQPEYTGGSVSYYRVKVEKPTSKDLPPYEAECNDIIEALQMNYAEGNAFKAIWRKCAAQLGKAKKGYTDGLYDSEKVEFFGGRMVAQNKVAR